MIQFTKLRLSGFKSFVDPTELLIDPGMTGVVGPNGCGKSNLVEALRWVMGETSAKQMRGGEMDDVIFGGTSHRPARNMADVTVVLDNSLHRAPVQFNDAEELEVTRRIERGQGSDYRCNGKPVRAKDVQLLFADAATGARSTAMVSQGRVSALINAKPSQRRSLLEEAAGIGGLYTRRHEAELRLRAAEGNLERLSDVIAALETQLASLRRQARQAQRYRSLSDSIRSTEALLLYRRWEGALQSLEAAKEQFREAERAVASLTGGTAAATAEQLAAADAVPALREADADAAARLQRLVIAREQLDAEEQRIASQRQQAEQRLQQITADMERERTRVADAEEALAALRGEKLVLEEESDGEDDMEVAARERVETLAIQVEGEEAHLTTLNDRLADEQAAWQAAERRVQDAQARLTRIGGRLRDAEATLQREHEAVGDGETLDLAREAVEEAALMLEEARLSAEEADLAAEDSRQAFDSQRDHLQEVAARRAKVRAEVDALSAVLAEAAGDGGWSPILDSISVAEGCEQALAAALGDDLSASEDGDAPVHWTALPPLATAPALPAGVQPLSDVVTASPVLARRLAQVGLVRDDEIGAALWTDLSVGQRLVTTEGALWRWDGLTVQAGAPSAAAIRLKQKNRLEQVRLELETAEQQVATATDAADAARAANEAALASARQRRDQVRAADSALASAQTALGAEERRIQALQGRLASAQALVDQLGQDRADARSELEMAEEQRLESPDSVTTRQEIDAVRASLSEHRHWLSEARSSLERVLRDAGERRQRLQRIETDLAGWEQRLRGADTQRAQLDERYQSVRQDLEDLAEKPQEIAESRLTLLDAIEDAETARKTTADALAVGEARLAEADRALRDAEKSLGGLREARVRAESAVEQSEAAVRQWATSIAERLDCTPTQARRLAGLESHPAAPGTSDGANQASADEPSEEEAAAPPMPSVPMKLSDLESRLSRLTRDRDAMGPVNLRAEAEAAELEAQMATLTTERDDLVAAIARLRQGIGELNKEGRHRLVASFEQVDTHFRRLFTRLFGGGRAHLALTESDDPLEAGLEIYASPPGKRLQILSLLSGGEQAMTAIALLFAVFLVNPAPICVLDEVDAPLDDANVDRFCSLLSELTRLAGGTPSSTVVPAGPAPQGEEAGEDGAQAAGDASQMQGGTVSQGSEPPPRPGTRFLVITHHRMTMARMDRLYGVTMAERGVSKLVSVDLRQAEALRDAG